MATYAPTELGVLPIGKALKKFAVPSIIAQTAASLYNMVDSIYIGHLPGVGSSAISGLAITFPIMNLSVAFGTLIGVGGMSLLSILLGRQDYVKAQKLLSNMLTLNTFVGVLLSLLTLPFLDSILRFFGASDATLPFARDYMFVILAGNAITHIYFGFNGLIRASGSPRTAMGLTLFTVISNAILDPIFIFVFGWGIQGAAIATILCQLLATIYTLRFFADKRNFLHFAKPVFQLDLKLAKQSLSIGLGPFLLNAAACLVALFINTQLGKYGGDIAIGAYGIVYRLSMLFVMICIGFNMAFQPIAGYNFGARKYGRVKQVFVLTVKCEVIVTTLCFLVSVLIPRAAVSLFTDEPELIEIAAKGLTLSNAAFALVGLGIVTTNLFQALGMVKTSIFLSLSRQILFLIPLVYFLPLWFGHKGVWLAFTISDAISVVVSFIFVVLLFKKLGKLADGDECKLKF